MPANGFELKTPVANVKVRKTKGLLNKRNKRVSQTFTRNKVMLNEIKTINRNSQNGQINKKGGNDPLSNRPVFDIEYGMRQVKGTLSIEGFNLEQREEELIKAKVLGILSEEEFLRKVLELANE
ncbi:hypothetical protein CVD25_02310 [Bacillus canaveralius]|uniref:Uncharacterized protein n=1 Tax=Bacillus canaveralius TaxID=1403243 RepID=A0A2N5GPA0_9BACI|nr:MULTISPECIES: hypothetical protein [Bacillus]PLR84396.1 hypothetical protein CU635_06485 [Bacillus canaveralius]PLR87020.1 hypothetical protein CVD23_05150 [Bacillus sp. V33-4]PLS00602.1 hypothetical protein CVD25_02310 [Bacillus canaveralius]RSK57889.1 hypothetical protein EJA13_00525 [Bacillus canaveralius]